MKCPACGTTITGNSSSCPSCGNEFRWNLLRFWTSFVLSPILIFSGLLLLYPFWYLGVMLFALGIFAIWYAPNLYRRLHR